MTSVDNIKRVLLLVLDSVGVGGAEDAAQFNDQGANTLGNIAKTGQGLDLPHLQSLGLGNIEVLNGCPPTKTPKAHFGRMAEVSQGKDTTSGHWELTGLPVKEPFAVYPKGFPQTLVESFEKIVGKPVLGNVAASGTEILKELGEQHLKSGRPIVYTSVDSVFQVAAHEEIIPLEELYLHCQEARKLCDPLRIGRVIARPFLGTSADNFKRTKNRRDFSLPPSSDTLLDRLTQVGIPVIGIGKIYDIFAGRGISTSYKTESNRDGMLRTACALSQHEIGLLFVNLIDFDMIFGHRCDVAGYKAALSEFDATLPELLARLKPDDLLIITADHGCDPTFRGTDHTREQVPLLVHRPGQGIGKNLGTRSSFADVAATIAEIFNVQVEAGESFCKEINL